MWDQFPEIKEELADVLKTIEKNIRIRDEQVKTIIRDLVTAGGKCLRPAYALLCSHIGPERDRNRAIAVAAAMECVHMATLIHDDVIDDAKTRHGRQTLHYQEGIQFAIYAGDYMFSMALNLLADPSLELKDMDVAKKRLDKILAGELEQLHSKYQLPLSLKNYLSRISGKTAHLFAMSCFAGAVGSRAPKQLQEIAWNLGHDIGMAFQIMDDILDYKSDEKTLGKPVFHDIRQGIYTLPLYYAMQTHSIHLAPILQKRDLSEEDLERIWVILKESRGIEKAEQLAKRYTEKAIKQIMKLPEGDYRNDLYNLTTLLLRRKM